MEPCPLEMVIPDSPDLDLVALNEALEQLAELVPSLDVVLTAGNRDGLSAALRLTRKLPCGGSYLRSKTNANNKSNTMTVAITMRRYS